MRTAALIAILSTACSPGAQPDTVAVPQPARARAALATVIVDNRSAEPLAIFYRMTTLPAAGTRIGRAPPDSITTMAPVPAGEPIILLARTATGAELTLTPRTFDIAVAWVWTIPANAVFIDRGAH
ncbi:hypothetical protein BH23GEM10_BH23GEM10_06400 [soil metagenome]